MIREANKYDKTAILEMLQQFGKESKIEHLKEVRTQEELDHLTNLVTNLLAGLGVILIEEGKGLIVGIITPSVWDKNFYMLHELAWFVKPEYRNTSIGYRLLKKFIEKGQELKQSGRIKATVMGKIASSPDIKYSKYGFEKLEENWILL